MARKSSGTEGIATTATLNQDVPVGGVDWLTVIAIVGSAANAAGAAGDVSIQVLPYLDDANSDLGNGGPVETLAPTTLALPSADSVAAILAASRAWLFVRYRVSGIHKVQIQVKNNNVATKPVEIDFGLG